MIVGIAATARDQRAPSSFSVSAPFSEHLRGVKKFRSSVKADYVASLILHANIAEVTVQELCCHLVCI